MVRRRCATGSAGAVASPTFDKKTSKSSGDPFTGNSIAEIHSVGAMPAMDPVNFSRSLVTLAHDGSVVIAIFDDADGCAALVRSSLQTAEALGASIAEIVAEAKFEILSGKG